jgi:hypothetical protein
MNANLNAMERPQESKQPFTTIVSHRCPPSLKVDSLTPKSVPAGTKNSRSGGFLLAKHKHTNIPTMMEPFSFPAAWF